MTLILSNDDMEQLLDIRELISTTEEALTEYIDGRAGNRLRTDIITPTPYREDALYSLKSMTAVIPKFGIGAARIMSDIFIWPEVDGKIRRKRLPVAPGKRFVALVIFFSTENGEPLIICQEAALSRLRVATSSAIGAKYLARKDADRVAILGSGFQAVAQLAALDTIRDIAEIRVYSPQSKNREAFAARMSERLDKNVKPCGTIEEACKGAQIVACATNALQPVFFKEMLEPGMHIGAIRPAATEVDRAAWDDIDVISVLDHDDSPEVIYTHGVQVGEDTAGSGMGMPHDEFHASLPCIAEIMTGRKEGRTSDDQITMFLNNLGMGLQFAAAGYLAHQKSKDIQIGHEIPTEWFTQDMNH